MGCRSVWADCLKKLPEHSSPANIDPAARRDRTFDSRFSAERVLPAALRAGGLVRRELAEALSQTLLERAIGVGYRPQSEFASHYFEVVLADQFDAYVWFEQSRAVTRLGTERPHGAPETRPFGL